MSLGLYLHLPFCRVHCSYCPFAISTDLSLQDAYTGALLREIDAKSSLPAARGEGSSIVDTLYLGGGTPSRLARSNLRLIIDRVRSRFVIAPGAEVTIEANPEDIDDEALADWQELGVNRISIGVQSFHDAELLPLGRVHGAQRALDAVKLAVSKGLRTSLDLILSLPNQTVASFRETLRTAIGLNVGHISLYMLDLEEGTPLAVQVERGRTTLPEEDDVAALYLEAVGTLGEAGLQQYEISNFARPGEESRHNLRYWRREPYHGLGLGAHSFLAEQRFANTRDIRRYIADPVDARDFEEELGEAEQRRETIFLRLRQASGIGYADLVRLTGQEGMEWTERGLRDGWLRREGARVAFTPSGFLLSNEHISSLF
ncbi:MAG TPA: radical SAM family heme chaperone HemW [Thermoanaerobaculia bacterium]|jgi:oxygen-independent coproporphyrinogen-3 oxidase|nr:radical SAM family heme chaperone HemW [Thermoanaerobaculia bacterium]